jgi:hypothetical protein
MVALLFFLLRLLASPFRSTSRLEAENAALKHQLIVFKRKVRGRVEFTVAKFVMRAPPAGTSRRGSSRWYFDRGASAIFSSS